jgi:hypothetical protein
VTPPNAYPEKPHSCAHAVALIDDDVLEDTLRARGPAWSS